MDGSRKLRPWRAFKIEEDVFCISTYPQVTKRLLDRYGLSLQVPFRMLGCILLSLFSDKNLFRFHLVWPHVQGNHERQSNIYVAGIYNKQAKTPFLISKHHEVLVIHLCTALYLEKASTIAEDNIGIAYHFQRRSWRNYLLLMTDRCFRWEGEPCLATEFVSKWAQRQ